MNSQCDKSLGRSQSRDLLFALGVAASLALLIIGGLFIFGRTDPDSSSQSLVSQQLSTSSDASTHPVPNRQTDNDQRLFATRRSIGEEAAERGPSAASDPAAEPTASANSAGESAGSRSSQASLPVDPSSDTAESATDEKTPRKLLKKARRQVKAGQTKAALTTSRQIAMQVEDPTGRSKLDAKLREAESAAGAGQTVDFESLIQLIEQTISPNSWDSVGGPGTVQSFAGGVYVDTGGLIRPRTKPADPGAAGLTRVRNESRPATDSAQDRKPGTLRKVSLPRLEKEVASRLAGGQSPTEEMRYLAGLTEVQYVLVYPEHHDVVLVGPAEDWMTDEMGRAVGRKSGRPVLQLDDLVVILRACFADSSTHGLFGCGIYPRAERIVRVQEFMARSEAAGSIEPQQRNAWLAELRDHLGPQDIEVFGVHPGSRVAHVLVEADYRMKLIGIGLEQAAVPGIPSYFDLLGEPDDARLARGLDTLRWWFTLNYDAILCSNERDAFKLRGARVQVLSENELLTATGQRVHTGQSDPVNTQFARNFTSRFSDLADRDVNFADLAGIFDLAVVSGLVRGYEINKAVGWPMMTFLDPDEYVLPLNPAPQTVETVLNHHVYRGRNILAAISGGVHVNPWKVVSQENLRVDPDGTLGQVRNRSQVVAGDNRHWWWE